MESYSSPYVEPLSDATCLREALRRRQGTQLAALSSFLREGSRVSHIVKGVMRLEAVSRPSVEVCPAIISLGRS
jgi:hypothetical protein